MENTYTPPPEIQGPSFHHAVPPNPAALLLPRMEPKVLHELAENIRSNGQQAPIVALVDAQGHRSVLDGISRLEALQLLGRPVIKNGALNPDVVKFQEISADDLGDPVLFVLSVNVFRRHLSSKTKRELTGNLLRLYPHKSDRQVAEMVGISHHTVADVRSELERCGQIAHVANRLDATGKRRQPATKAPKVPANISAVPASEPKSLESIAVAKADKYASQQQLSQIAQDARECLAMLDHAAQHDEAIRRRLNRIIQWAEPVKQRATAITSSNARFDRGALARGLAISHA